ncbi:hypothetical protein [Halomonas sp. NO4]|uniref:hypothetical protein n=1 Tax=Halomonas sp. NO4 TaxID=2484813 RepID=UPI0013D253E5|nr:hypothetical protein [Halomonas sp. NO4]
MTLEATHAGTDAADEIEALAQQAEWEEQAEQAQAEPDPGEWEDGEAQEEQARALAKMAVQGVEMAAGLIHPGHGLDSQSRAHGEDVMLPVARDFSGEVPEWLRPYMHYLGAGLWIGGVLVGAYRARRAEDAERERQAEQQAGEGAHGGQS